MFPLHLGGEYMVSFYLKVVVKRIYPLEKYEHGKGASLEY